MKGNALSEYPSYSDDPTGSVGGEEKHTLLEPEMPRHNHAVYTHAGFEGGETPGASGVPPDNKTKVHARITSSTGSSLPHNNMPPYIALYFCKYEGSR
jgi:microcystin-dependent protein